MVDATPAATLDGEVIYREHCAACHDDGLNGAPALDHVPSWASRSPDWSAVLKQHAMSGFITMPAAGGNPALSAAEVGAAVDYMLSRIRPPALPAGADPHGRVVYQAACSRCHDSGDGGAPMIGDEAAWAARSLNWHTVLEAHANGGYLSMPAKGEQLQLFERDVADAVAFIVAWSRRN
jgi:cytochrome c5